MNQIESLVKAYAAFVKLPWSATIVGAQRVWFAVYEPAQEKRLRFRLEEFEIATKDAGHKWAQVDITNTFAEWMISLDYSEEYFADPEALLELPDFTQYLAQHIITALQQPDIDDNTVLAVIGLGSLFGLALASEVFEKVTPQIPGRLLVFFPGQRDGSNYRLLDARDGWNYLAIPITAVER